MFSGRVRVTLGLILAIGGSLWLAGGTAVVSNLLRAGLRALPVVLVVIGVGGILRLAVPRRSLTGPMLLLAAGSLGLAYQVGWIPLLAPSIAPALTIAIGAAVALTGRASEASVVLPVRYYTSILLPIRVEAQGRAPARAAVRCLLGRIELDLSGTAFPDDAHRVTVDMTILGGSVTLVIPHNWSFRTGPRLHLAHGTKFSGSVTSVEPAPDLPEDRELGQRLVVLNVRGLGGWVGITRSYSGDGPPVADESAPAGG